MYTRHIIYIFNTIWTFIFLFKRMITAVKLYFSLFETHPIILVQIVCIVARVQQLWCFNICGTYFCVSIISSTALLTMAWFSCCLLIYPLGMGLLPGSSVGLPLSYLVLKSPRTLHSSEECPGPWTRQVLISPSIYLHVIFWACQYSHPSQGKSMTRRILLSFAFCDHNGWLLPR